MRTLAEYKELLRTITKQKNFWLRFWFFATFLLVVLLSIVFKIPLTTFFLIIFAVEFTIIMIFTWSMATVAIFKSLFIASTGLTLIILFADEYCNLKLEYHYADDSLKVVVGLGLIYISVSFGISIFKQLYGDKESTKTLEKIGAIKALRQSTDSKIFFGVLVVFYLLPLGYLLWHVIQVVSPIVLNFCIYK